MIVEEQKTDLILIRHAESENNKALSEFIRKNNIQDYSWAKVCNNQEFLRGIKYSPQLMDCSISQKGVLQCKEARVYTNTLKPEVILVSPLHRTLETCNILFGEREIPIFVEPILSEGLRSACDVSRSMKQKLEIYKNWNFSQTLNNDCWFIDHQLPEMRQILLESIKNQKKELSAEQKSQRILQKMHETMVFQSPASIRQRAKQIKKLLSKYKQKYETICIVSHYNTINFLVAKQFDEKGDAINPPCLSNCQIHHAKFQQICKYQ